MAGFLNELQILRPALTTQIPNSGDVVLVADTTMGEKGGVIINPLNASDQGLPVAEVLFINIVTNAVNHPATVELVPGQWFLVPPKTNVWASAYSSGHKFTAFFTDVFTVQYPPSIVPGQPDGPITPGSDVGAIASEPGAAPFPPSHVTGLTDVIPSYLYQQYTDDDDLQGWVEAQNIMQQDYVDTFNALNLPIYTGPVVSNKLLDWVARGVYGYSRPTIGENYLNIFGPLNTWGCNWLVPMWEFPELLFFMGDWNVASNTPDIRPSVIVPFNGYYFNARTVNPAVGEAPPSSIPMVFAYGVTNQLIYDGDKVIWDQDNQTYRQVRSHAIEAMFGLNMIGLYGPENVILASDDIYRRCLTWHFFKGDGNYFSTTWLKRRVWRFCYCTDGTNSDFAVDPMTGKQNPTLMADENDAYIADLEQISVTIGAPLTKNVTIRFVLGKRTITGGSMLNRWGPNGFEPAFGIGPRPPPADMGGGAWDIGTDDKPSQAGANYQFNSWRAAGTGTCPATNQLTVSGVTGTITPGCSVLGTGVPNNIQVIGQISGTTGKDGVYGINLSVSISGVPLSFGSNQWEELGGGGASVAPGGIYLNDIETTYEPYPPLPFMRVFKDALDTGVLEVPFQWNFTCKIG